MESHQRNVSFKVDKKRRMHDEENREQIRHNKKLVKKRLQERQDHKPDFYDPFAGGFF